MAAPIKRRDFIKGASLLGSSLAMADPAAAGSFLSGNTETEIKNDYFTVSFDRGKGKINIYRSGGIPLLTGGTACINTVSGKRSVDSGNYNTGLNQPSSVIRLVPENNSWFFPKTGINELISKSDYRSTIIHRLLRLKPIAKMFQHTTWP